MYFFQPFALHYPVCAATFRIVEKELKMRKSIQHLVVLLLVLSTPTAIFVTAAAFDKTAGGIRTTNEALVRVEGTIVAVDLDERVVVVDPLRGGDLLRLRVTDDTIITLDGRPARLGDLHRGFAVGALFDRMTHEAARINAESFAEVRGTVRDVGAVQGTLTIAIGGGDRTITLNVGPATPVSLNGRPAMLEDLRRGFHVIASYVESTLDAVRIAATSIADIAGHIRDVDVESGVVAIVELEGETGVRLQVVETTRITVNGIPTTIERLQPGMPVRAAYHIVSFEAITIAARIIDGDQCTLFRIGGTVKAVNLRDSTLTIAPDLGGRDLTFTVVPRTEILINGRPSRLSDLNVGMNIWVKFCRESLTAVEVLARVP